MKYFYFIAILILSACGGSTDSASPQNVQKESSTQASVPSQTFPIAYYLASEFGGSWVLEMNMEQNGSFSVVFKDSGSGINYQGIFQKSPPIVDGKVVVEGNEVLFNGVLEGASSGLAATIRIKGEECKSKNGSTSNSTCEVKFDNKTFTGCGKYVD